jgi:hypothetical protein
LRTFKAATVAFSSLTEADAWSLSFFRCSSVVSCWVSCA